MLGGAVAPEDWSHVSKDLAGFIRAVAQLQGGDVQALELLNLVFADVIKVYPNMHDPNVFTEREQELLQAIDGAGIDREDFYSSCRRLEGFGLAMEVPRNPTRMSPGEYCFRASRRGLRLLRLLENDSGRQGA